MTNQLKPGDRVEYVGRATWFAPDDPRTGTVEKLYAGYRDEFDGDELTRSTQLPYPQRWSASVRVDRVPTNWPYNTDKFAPDICDLKRID